MEKAPPIAKRLKQARLKAGLSQKQLGIRAGIDPFSASPRVNQYERAKHTPDYGTAERLTRVLGLPAAFLYAKEDDLAELIALFERLPAAGRRKLLAQIRRSAGKQKK
jgi:transcriptional regulator with XRE-family HTH domain